MAEDVEQEMTVKPRRPLLPADLERMHVPEEFWRVKIQQVSGSVRDVIERYLINIDEMVKKGAGLLLTGNEGVGKTSIGVLIGKEAVAAGHTAYFTPIWELREHFKSKIMFDDALSVYDRVMEVDVLILDGLKAADVKEFALGDKGIAELIESRSMRLRVTILTAIEMSSLMDVKESLPNVYAAMKGHVVPLHVDGQNQLDRKQAELTAVVLGKPA